MKKAYIAVRLISYVCGLIGVVLVIQGDAEAQQVGYMLVLLMFLLFCASYVLYALIKTRAKSLANRRNAPP